MDSSSWIHGYGANTAAGGNSGFMCGYAASCVAPEGLQTRNDQLVSSQIQHHLNQISMQMNMDDEPAAACIAPFAGDGGAVGMQQDLEFLPWHHNVRGCSFPSSFRSASFSCSLEISSATGRHFPEVSSQSHVPLPALVPYDNDDHHHQWVVTAAMTPDEMPTSAFRRYARHLGPRRGPKAKPGCGQKMFKTAMSMLTKMHTAMRYSHQQYYYQQASAAASPAEVPSVNQLQHMHMISERKRREKFNDSFHALKTVLPPGSKKDKTSILIAAREYVGSLKSKVKDLEEKNRALLAQLAKHARGAGIENESDKVQIQITRAAAAADQAQPRVRIAARPAQGNSTAVDQMGEDEVSQVAMNTCDSRGGGSARGRRAVKEISKGSGRLYNSIFKEI